MPMDSSLPRITDFVPLQTLEEIRSTFEALTGFEAVVTDRACGLIAGRPCEQLINLETDKPALSETGGGCAPIRVDGESIGAICMTGRRVELSDHDQRLEPEAIAEKFSIPDDCLPAFIQSVGYLVKGRREEALHFLQMLAAIIEQTCEKDITLRRRVDEMTALYRIATLLANQRDLDRVLETVTRSTAEVMKIKAASIRLLDDRGELVLRSMHGLSERYVSKGPVLYDRSEVDRAAMRGEVISVDDMRTDPRVTYSEDAKREHIVSMLCTGLIYRSHAIGTMRVYADEAREFDDNDRELLRAIAQLAAVAIQNARYDQERTDAQRMQRQVQLAADVQRRMMPQTMPEIAPLDVAGRYEPCFELGGDFFDLMPLGRSLGMVVGDVVGKGVPAGLLMASVRGSIRAHVEDIYDIDHVMAKVNRAMAADTRDNEFATVFYATIDADSLRMTYCSAGHDPVLHVRDGQVSELPSGGMILGIDPEQQYEKGIVHLKPGDVLFAYTDGVTDAMNFDHQRFGRERVKQAVIAAAGQSAKHILNHVLWEVRRFVGLCHRPDDMTLVVIKVQEDAEIKPFSDPRPTGSEDAGGMI